jgi:hypothetical protein
MNEGLLSFIEDPTLVAQRQILANLGGGSMMPAQMQMQMPMQAQAQSGLLGSGLLGSGLINTAPSMTGGAPLIQDYRLLANRFRAESDARAAAAAAAAAAASDSGGGSDSMPSEGGQFSGRGVGADNLAFGILGATEGPLGKISPVGALANYGAGQYLDARTDYIGEQDFGLLNNVPGGMGTFADQYGNVGTYSNQGTLDAQIADLQNAPYSGVGGGAIGSINNSMNLGDMLAAQDYGTGGSYDPVGQGSLSSESVSQALSDAGYSDTGGYGEGNTSTSSKIVCTAMNHAYGFGSFRNKIWLAYSAKNLTKAHEVGYHALFLPLVAVGYNQGDKMHNRIVRRVLENIARHRSADLRAEMRGTKRDPVGRAYRLILEPLCFAVGKLKGY